MTAAAPANSAPPEAELQFDVGSTDDSLERMIELFARHGDTYRVFVPARRSYTYVIHHPDDVKRVLVSNHRNYTKGVGLDRVKILLGKGIMTSEGELWKRQRYMMQPLFHRRVITEFAQRHRGGERPLHRPLGSARRARRAGEPHRRDERAHARDRAALDLRPRSRSPDAAARRQSLRGGHPGAVARSAVRLQVPLAHQARGAAHRAPPRRARGALRLTSPCS